MTQQCLHQYVFPTNSQLEKSCSFAIASFYCGHTNDDNELKAAAPVSFQSFVSNLFWKMLEVVASQWIITPQNNSSDALKIADCHCVKCKST